MLQMWAAFVHELAGHEPPSWFAGCVRPEETSMSHEIFTAALRPQHRAHPQHAGVAE